MEDNLCFIEATYSCKWKMETDYLSPVPEPKLEANQKATTPIFKYT